MRAKRFDRRQDVWRIAVVGPVSGETVLVDAVAELEAAGFPDPFARVAAAAGVSRQALRELFLRARST